ncbi:MAG: hypothetical protein LBU83_02640 [Bacteroidales bacterium]|jgi:hypothetical protein|nr:hypothetical protein [Bacteroidales bacterium]
MENQNTSNQDCGCSDGCCTPLKKSSPWKTWIFILIILAAGVIIAVKLLHKQEAPPPEKCCDKTENPACCQKSETEE